MTQEEKSAALDNIDRLCALLEDFREDVVIEQAPGIKVELTYYSDIVTLSQIERMTHARGTDYDATNSVWRLMDGAVLGSTYDGRYFDVKTKKEYYCIMAQEYDDCGEPVEGVVLGFILA